MEAAMTPFLRTALTLAALALAAPPALAEAPVEAPVATPPGPGFWIYPAAPAATTDDLMDLCQHGMTLVQPDGSWMSFLATEAGLVVDAEAVCRIEGGSQVCAVQIYDPDGALTAQTHDSRFDRDAMGHLRAHLTLDSGRRMTSYPQACPDAAVRDLMVGWLAPRPVAAPTGG
jgi:YD repeat-containing protein